MQHWVYAGPPNDQGCPYLSIGHMTILQHQLAHSNNGLLA